MYSYLYTNANVPMSPAGQWVRGVRCFHVADPRGRDTGTGCCRHRTAPRSHAPGPVGTLGGSSTRNHRGTGDDADGSAVAVRRAQRDGGIIRSVAAGGRGYVWKLAERCNRMRVKLYANETDGRMNLLPQSKRTR